MLQNVGLLAHMKKLFGVIPKSTKCMLKADFQSVEFSERAEILLFVGENVALKLNR